MPSRSSSEPTGAQAVGNAVQGWLTRGLTAAFARVIEVRGIGAATLGEVFALNEPGESAGELLGGVVAGRVREAAGEVLADPRLGGIATLELEVEDANAVEAGLNCGGSVTVVVQSSDHIPTQLWIALAEQRPVALSTVVDSADHAPSLVTLDRGGSFGSLGDRDLEQSVEGQARRLLAAAESASHRSEHLGRTVLIEAFVPDVRIVIVGEGVLADAIVRQADALGWPSCVVADEIGALQGLDWAGASAAVVMLSHSPDVDAPVLGAAIRRGVPYVGALGSRRTQQARADRLRSLGLLEDEIGLIHGPIGLDLGSSRPQNIALSICAEILANRSGRSGTSLREGDGPIRHRISASEPEPVAGRATGPDPRP